jgi:hypothetical protein
MSILANRENSIPYGEGVRQISLKTSPQVSWKVTVAYAQKPVGFPVISASQD